MKFHWINLSNYQIALAKKVAEHRAKLHEGQASMRVLSNDYEYTGILGEIAFSQAYLFGVDFSDRISGDSGVDFRTPLGTVDVKTYQKPYNLIVEVGKPVANILVLAHRSGRLVRFVGWEYGEVMLKQPYRDFGYGVINHYKSARQLHTMAEFESMLLA